MSIDTDKLKQWLKYQQAEAQDMDNTEQYACFGYVIEYLEYLEKQFSEGVI